MSNIADDPPPPPPQQGFTPEPQSLSPPPWELRFLSCLFIPQQFSAKDVSQEAHSWLSLLAFPPTQQLVTLL